MTAQVGPPRDTPSTRCRCPRAARCRRGSTPTARAFPTPSSSNAGRRPVVRPHGPTRCDGPRRGEVRRRRRGPAAPTGHGRAEADASRARRRRVDRPHGSRRHPGRRRERSAGSPPSRDAGDQPAARGWTDRGSRSGSVSPSCRRGRDRRRASKCASRAHRPGVSSAGASSSGPTTQLKPRGHSGGRAEVPLTPTAHGRHHSTSTDPPGRRGGLGYVDTAPDRDSARRRLRATATPRPKDPFPP